MTVKGNTDHAIKFLKLLRPDGPWTVVAINPENGKIHVRTFQLNEINELKSYIETYNGKWNCYFQLNPTIKSLNKKATRQEIEAVA